MTNAALMLLALLAVPELPAQRPAAARPRMALDLVVSGPKESQPGDLVVLDSSNSQGVSAGTWTISPLSAAGRMLVVENGTKVVFATSQPARYVFYFAACTADGKTIRIVPHEVVVGGVPPNPVPPGPQPGPTPPNPGPTPPVPPGPTPTPDRYGLAAFVVQQVAQISDSDKVNRCRKFADICDGVIAQIGAGALRTPDEVSAALREAVMANTPWLTLITWRALLPELGRKFEALKLTTPDELAQALTEVAAGLRAVR